ncbi:uncharacterized protein cubi_02725 [Cryptosporidium ubiquitum]|uniref:RNA polymerase II subunit B1 CTD phosphatase RPAP2 homolog n=1 Tax=Cryptosporidium ubiquitum TaxID=857276 RepID=A0A1J4MKE7_9CRYT|nr:uncharacterized protein cubi_02725 [Cryptosporidium ubiquitum]OII73923.1 hypothetical protein cubi_02725 [Cryptosporidium ubiquitum]
MPDNSRLFKEKLRRELIEKHVKGIENSNLISLKFQERLIDNEGRLDDEVILKIQSFLRPCDLEEISIERSDKSKCGWIQCEMKIPKSSSSYSKSKWALDKSSGNIIERSTLSLFCSTNCYYLYLDLSISLSETHPHLRSHALINIQKWLNLDQIEEQNDKEAALKNEMQERTDLTNTSNCTANDVPLNSTSDIRLLETDKDQKMVKFKDEEITKEVNTKGQAELENILETIKSFRSSNTQYKFNQIVKQFDYLEIEESESKNSLDLNSVDLNDQKTTEITQGKEETQEDQGSQEELDDPEYTYQDMMQVLQDISEDDDDDYDSEEDEEENDEEVRGDRGEIYDEKLEKKNKRSGNSQDYVLLMTQFYDNLSPEVVILDLLTSFISEETRDLIKSKCIVNLNKNSKKEESNKENNKINEFNTIQIDRRNVLKDNLSGYISSIEWISHTKLLVFTIYRILDTFIFPFSVPNLKQSCLELLTFILIEVITDHEVHFDITNYFESLQDEIKTKAEQWIFETRRKYDSKFIDNIKLLFISKD